MKKTIFILSACMFAGLVTANAQSDSTSIKSNNQQSPTSGQVQTTPGQTKTPRQSEMTRVKSSEIPASLRQTLQGAEYKGWENSTLYRSPNSDLYTIDISDANRTRSYRFDKNGKRLNDK